MAAVGAVGDVGDGVGAAAEPEAVAAAAGMARAAWHLGHFTRRPAASGGTLSRAAHFGHVKTLVMPLTRHSPLVTRAMIDLLSVSAGPRESTIRPAIRSLGVRSCGANENAHWNACQVTRPPA